MGAEFLSKHNRQNGQLNNVFSGDSSERSTQSSSELVEFSDDSFNHLCFDNRNSDYAFDFTEYYRGTRIALTPSMILLRLGSLLYKTTRELK